MQCCDAPQAPKFTLLIFNSVSVLLETQFMSRYKPGDCIEGAGGTKAGDYILPEITTLLLVGPRGAGKSTLVNRITRVFDKDDDPFAPDRAQVSRKFLYRFLGCCFMAMCNWTCLSLTVYFARKFKIKWYTFSSGVPHSEEFNCYMYLWYTELIKRSTEKFQYAAAVDDKGNQPWGNNDMVSSL